MKAAHHHAFVAPVNFGSALTSALTLPCPLKSRQRITRDKQKRHHFGRRLWYAALPGDAGSEQAVDAGEAWIFLMWCSPARTAWRRLSSLAAELSNWNLTLITVTTLITAQLSHAHQLHGQLTWVVSTLADVKHFNA